MPQQFTLTDEIVVAFESLPLKDQKLIELDLAHRAVETVLDKCTRVRDSGQAIRYTLSEHHIGSQGQRVTRQKIFGAYWRLLRKILDKREVRARRIERRKRRV